MDDIPQKHTTLCYILKNTFATSTPHSPRRLSPAVVTPMMLVRCLGRPPGRLAGWVRNCMGTNLLPCLGACAWKGKSGFHWWELGGIMPGWCVDSLSSDRLLLLVRFELEWRDDIFMHKTVRQKIIIITKINNKK